MQTNLIRVLATAFLLVLAAAGILGCSDRQAGSDALLQGLLHCLPCSCAMTPAHAIKHGSKWYRYYVCTGARQRGRHTCPAPSLPAAAIERFVLEQLQAHAQETPGHEAVAALDPHEQARLVTALVERVDYDGAQGKVAIRLRPGAILTPDDPSVSQLQEHTP